ncbi:MAG: 1-acyl-sn-glycerol-3-phosphate acyltransferase [Prevotellaceae bacterium]|jgi:1-acyl-sn-glycerol-3-phosphate acyltransferase|nr:1-acyl-sn-glycerol-3-phosphate acyltransferase [Prevotellaceae bacterium]
METTIYKKTLLYSVLRIYSNFIYRRWFSTIEINGENSIPENSPVIFAPNHQNGFIDAMALLSSSPKPVVFLARADLFRKKTLDKILRALKIMPAYRIRDGIRNLKKNEDSFGQAVEVLLHKEFFCLMPEGGQEEVRTLRPLVKGMFRIAFAAQEVLKDTDSVKIVPVGIDYGNYDHSGSHLIVNFGKAINIREYYDAYLENAPVAQNQLRDELSKRMSPLMLNIRSEKYYDCFYITSYLYNAEMLDEMGLDDNETNRLAARQRIVSLLQKAEGNSSPLLPELNLLCKKWAEKHKDIAFSAQINEFGRETDGNLLVSFIYLLITFPLFLYSALVNGIPYLLTKFLTRKAKGTGFQASFVFGLSGILFPVFYLLEIIAFTFVAPTFWTGIAFIFSLPLSFFFMLRYKWRFRFVRERIKNIFVKDKEVPEILSYAKRLLTDK